MNLQEKTVKELRIIAKDLRINGRTNMRKEELIEAIKKAEIEESIQEIMIVERVSYEVAEDMFYEQMRSASIEITEEYYENEEVEEQVEEENRAAEELILGVQVEIPVKPSKPRGEQRKVNLLNPENEIVKTFEEQKNAIQFVVREKYCNIGWAKNSLKTGKSFYQKDDGSYTCPQKKSGYHGVAYRLVYSI